MENSTVKQPLIMQGKSMLIVAPTLGTAIYAAPSGVLLGVLATVLAGVPMSFGVAFLIGRPRASPSRPEPQRTPRA